VRTEIGERLWNVHCGLGQTHGMQRIEATVKSTQRIYLRTRTGTDTGMMGFVRRLVFYQRHLKITQTFFREITPAGYNFVNSFNHAFLPDILVTEDALNTRDTINNIGILCERSEILRKQ